MTKKLRGRLSLSKAESDQPVSGKILTIGQGTEINLPILDPSRLLIGMREELRHLLRENIAFDVSMLARGRCLVSADRHQLRELLLHLVLDAQDGMPNGGSLSIAIDRKRIGEAASLYPELLGDYVIVSVHDSPTREATRISERADFRVLKGRGLSLAASYDVIKRCDGHISVSRRAGETIVRIFLPSPASRSAQAAFGSASR
jgi:two-component system cell cycle sensor histidine kinase/response regulator CckA